MAPNSNKPLLVIVGPTASGKSDIAMKIAKKRHGEIICADSRTIYKGMDLGTAKPTKQDQKEVAHHLIDVVQPGGRFTAHDFKRQAEKVIEDIWSRNKLPILVGGTGLYVDSVVLDYQFPPEASSVRRLYLETLTTDQLIDYCYKNNIILPKNNKNKRHLVAAILHKNSILPDKRKQPKMTTHVVGITTEKTILRQRIARRAEYIFSHGVVEEAKELGKMYGWNNEAMTGNVYPLIKDYLEGELTLQEVKDKLITLEWRLAKRQLTWLKRHSFIHWSSLDRAENLILAILAKTEQK